ncbi:MAG: hypothetical protein GC136_08450 [Alphaproteobacteria bacterium]|nr:hypothetical protein [Alphaproteobacteria bacterium]
MSLQGDLSDILSMLGLSARERDWLASSGFVLQTSISTDLASGLVHGLQARVTEENPQSYKVEIRHLYHPDNQTNQLTDVLTFRLKSENGGQTFKVADGDVGIWRKATKKPTEKDGIKLVGAFHDIWHELRRNRWTNPVPLLEKNGLPSQKALPGLYGTGEIKIHDAKVQDKPEDVFFEAEFLPAILGIGADVYAGRQKFQHTLSARGERGAFYALKLNGEIGRTPANVKLSCTLTRRDGQQETTEEIYSLETVGVGDNDKQARLKSLTFHGEKREHRNRKVAGRFLDAIREHHTLIRRGENAADIDDLFRMAEDGEVKLPTDIMLRSDLYPHLQEKLEIGPKGRAFLTIEGGNPHDEIYLSNHDHQIGANRYIFEFHDKPAKTKPARVRAVGVDAGVQFQDKADLAAVNVDAYYKRRFDPDHKPHLPLMAEVITHGHMDHVGFYAYLVKAGYDLPLLIMTPMTRELLRRKMMQLKIEPKVVWKQLDNCHVIDLFFKSQDDGDFDLSTNTYNYNGTEFTQSWEPIKDKAGKTHYYPVLDFGGDMKLHLAAAPHSLPGFMVHFDTPADSWTHTGDWKPDDTLRNMLPGMPPLDPWLEKHQPTLLTTDSTGSLKEDDVPTEAQIKEGFLGIYKKHPKQRFLFALLGSNLARLMTIIEATTEAGKDALLMDGKAVNDLIKDLDATYMLITGDEKNFRQHIFDEYGLQIYLQTQSNYKKILEGEPVKVRYQKTDEEEEIAGLQPEPKQRRRKTKASRDFLEDDSIDEGDFDDEEKGVVLSYSMAVTGTQDEPYSSLNQAARDLNRRYRLTKGDVLVNAQGVIPTGENKERRKSVIAAMAEITGATLYFPEAIEKESNIIVAGSGHTTKPGQRDLIKKLGLPVVIPVHGGPDQLKAHVATAQEVGAKAYRATNSSKFELVDGDVREVQSIPNQMLYITTAAHDTFGKMFLAPVFSTQATPMKGPLLSKAGALVEIFERAVTRGRKIQPELISRQRGFIAKKVKFGIEKYRYGALKDKDITVVAGCDTETTGIRNLHQMTQFALVPQQVKDRAFLDPSVFYERMQDGVVASPGAEFVTQRKLTDHQRGDNVFVFANRMFKAIRDLRKTASELYTADHKKPDKAFGEDDVARKEHGKQITREARYAKAMLVFHNGRFDDRFIRAELGRGGVIDNKPHSGKGVFWVDTRVIARALHAYSPGILKVGKNKETGLVDFSLKALCQKNGIEYDESKAHANADYDAERALALFWLMQDKAPKIVDQMILNADYQSNHLLNDIWGIDCGYGPHTPYPVFSYMSARADKPDPKMGCFIGSFLNRRYAIVFNLAYDPAKYFNLPEAKIKEMLDDPNCDVFEKIDLQMQPIVMPPRVGIKVGAHNGLPIETLDKRASAMKMHLQTARHDHKRTLAEKIDNVLAADMFMREEVDWQESGPSPVRAIDAWEKQVLSPDMGFIELKRMKTGLADQVKQELFKKVNEYLNKVKKYAEDFGEDAEQTEENKANIASHFDAIMRYQHDYTQAIQLYICTIQYDIDRRKLSADQVKQVETYRAIRAYITNREAQEEFPKTGDSAFKKEYKPYYEAANQNHGEVTDKMRAVGIFSHNRILRPHVG